MTGIYGGVDLPGDCWGADTSIAGALTDEQLLAMWNVPLPPAPGSALSRPLRFLWGYVPLPGNAPGKGDMTGPRMRAACDMGWIVLLVQHCPSGAWIASKERGAAAGQCAAEYASAQGYPPDCHLALDDESVRNAGSAVLDDVAAWCSTWPSPCVYEGFSPGLSAQALYALPDVMRYWGAYGPWDVATRGVCCRQGLQATHAGVAIDPDHAFPDKLGGMLRGMGRLPDTLISCA